MRERDGRRGRVILRGWKARDGVTGGVLTLVKDVIKT